MTSFFRPTSQTIILSLALTALGLALFYQTIVCALDGSNGCGGLQYVMMVPAFLFCWPALIVLPFTADIFPVPLNIASAFAVSWVWVYLLVCVGRWGSMKIRRSKKTPWV